MKVNGNNKPEKDANQAEDTKEIPKKPKKKTEAEGSRWAGFVLLLITLVVGLMFYFKG